MAFIKTKHNHDTLCSTFRSPQEGLIYSSSTNNLLAKLSSFHLLPEDVVFQILLCLPVVSLLQFKSVCKLWHSVIERPHFITQHFRRPQADNLLVMDPTHAFDNFIYDLNFSLLSGDNLEVSQDVDLPLCFRERSGGNHGLARAIRFGSMSASCNGIVCLHHRPGSDVSLWNPAMRQSRVLPKSPVPFPQADGLINIFVGFVFDVKTIEYKVVRFYFTGYGLKRRVDVYNLSTDSWKTLDVCLPVDFIASDPKTPYRDGTYCWLGRNDYSENPSSMILSFDITNEVFDTIPLPDIYSSNPRCSIPGYILVLAILQGKIACIEFRGVSLETESWNFEIWVLNEYGVKESWTKLCKLRFGNIGSWADPIGCLDSQIIMLLRKKHCSCDPLKCYCDRSTMMTEMCLCNPVTQERKILPVHITDPYNLKVVVYKESLVSIKNINDAAIGTTCAVKPRICFQDAVKEQGIIAKTISATQERSDGLKELEKRMSDLQEQKQVEKASSAATRGTQPLENAKPHKRSQPQAQVGFRLHMIPLLGLADTLLGGGIAIKVVMAEKLPLQWLNRGCIKSTDVKMLQPMKPMKAAHARNQHMQGRVNLNNPESPDHKFWLSVDQRRILFEMAFLMADQALVTPGKLVYDPFVGTGSILVGAAHSGGNDDNVLTEDGSTDTHFPGHPCFKLVAACEQILNFR
ncbi:hypothetical protein IFM89_028406 [Coptis chinensis]|uniref:F-box domain-containing protein n=1 Tax=Coptis chinensis TaxID=261450 RepID=A0A835H9G4_9MAGN|nr:hypothetical protein IFM89_028406 [Coptis chinensis]